MIFRLKRGVNQAQSLLHLIGQVRTPRGGHVMSAIRTVAGHQTKQCFSIAVQPVCAPISVG